MENETKPTDTTSDDSIMMLLRDNSREKSDTSSFELKNLIIVVNDLTTRVQFLENEDNPYKIECGSAMVLPRSLSGVKTMAMWL